MSRTDRLTAAATAYALDHPRDRHIDVAPRLQVAVVACMDSRIDLFGLLGLQIGDVHMLRNAGGVVTDDVVRSLVLSQRVLGTREVVLIHHTDCGLQKTTDEKFKAELEAETGVRPPWALEAFRDPAENVRQSIRRVQLCPWLPHREDVRGFVYDVDDHALIEVAPPPR